MVADWTKYAKAQQTPVTGGGGGGGGSAGAFWGAMTGQAGGAGPALAAGGGGPQGAGFTPDPRFENISAYGAGGNRRAAPGADLPGGTQNQGGQYQYYQGNPNAELFDLMGRAGGDWQQMMNRLLQGWEGRTEDLPGYFEKFKPFILANLMRTDSARDLTETNRMVDLTYAPAAAQIGQAGALAARDARGAFAQAGLGLSGAAPGYASQVRLSTAGQQGAMMNALLSNQLLQRWNMQRDVAGMAVGMPGQSAGGGSAGAFWGNLAGGIGQGLGSLAGGIAARNSASQPSSGYVQDDFSGG